MTSHALIPLSGETLCECGCGRPTGRVTKTDRRRGVVKGEPCRFILGHARRVDPSRLAEHFWASVEIGEPEECWPWMRGTDGRGYGQCGLRHYKTARAHRIAYELTAGPIPGDLTIDHLCRNRLCCNPSHLEPCERGENTLRGRTITAANAAKTHCKHGHEFTPENTYVYPVGSKSAGERACRVCIRDTQRRYQARLKAAA